MDEAALLAALQENFGYSQFRPGQADIIKGILAGKDVLGILPTGSGKSLCYQLPEYMLGGLTVIVSPLIALMQDQLVQLRLQGEKKAAVLNSTLTRPEQHFILQHLEQYHFLFSSPETLNRPDVWQRLQKHGVTLFVIDEAHCISQWGVDFRPSYLSLGDLKRKLAPGATLMLTATATPRVQADILTELDAKAATRVVYSVDRPNIFLDVVDCPQPQQKDAILLNVLQHIQYPGIIYFSSRQKAEEMAQMIQQRLHLPVAYYHGSLSTKDRYLIQSQFMSGALHLICATSAFGMGVNKQNIRFVIHYHAPSDFESYLQEIGRAGRDGKQSIAILLTSPSALARQLSLLDLNQPSAELIQAFFAKPQRFDTAKSPELALLADFKAQAFQAEQVIEMQQRKWQEKKQSLFQFHDFVMAADCRRSVLLNHFGQTRLPKHSDKCCLPGFDPQILSTLKELGLYVQQPDFSAPPISGPSIQSWTAVLKYLLE